MNTPNVEVTVVYKDNFSEVHHVNMQEWEQIILEAEDDSRLDFCIHEKQFHKKEIDLIAIADYSIQFLK